MPKSLPVFQATLTSTSSNSGVQYVIQFTLLTSSNSAVQYVIQFKLLTSSNSAVQYVIQFTLLTNQIHEIESQFLAIFNGAEVLVEDVQVAATVLGVPVTVVGIAVITGVAAAVTSRETLRAVYAVYSCQLLETSRSVWRSEDS